VWIRGLSAAAAPDAVTMQGYKMKTLIAILLLASATTSFGDEMVRGYIRKDGTYVQPHFRSSPNNYKFDNYGSQGNVNPYTGRKGYAPNELSTPYTPPSYNALPYGQPQYVNPYGLGD
jgi:hypothetical protein